MYLKTISTLSSLHQLRLTKKQSSLSDNNNSLQRISNSFDENLLQRLKPLTFLTTSITPNLTFNFLSLALDILSSTHKDVETLFSDLKSSFNFDDQPLNLYLDDSVKLLDVCNSISSEIEQFQKNRILINFVLNLLEFSGDEIRQIPTPEKLKQAKISLSDWLNYSAELKKQNLNNSAILIQKLAVRLDNPPRGKIKTVKKFIHRIIYTVEAVTIFVTSVVLFALTGSPMKIRVRVSGEFLWAETYNRLVSTLSIYTRKMSTENKRRFIEDLDDVDKCVTNVCDVIDFVAGRDHFGINQEIQKEKLSNAVEELKIVMTALSNSLDGLFNGVKVLFDSVLGARECLLEKIRVTSWE